MVSKRMNFLFDYLTKNIKKKMIEAIMNVHYLNHLSCYKITDEIITLKAYLK